jgi:hypothetical protein
MTNDISAAPQTDELETNLADRIHTAAELVQGIEYTWRDAARACEILGYARARVDALDAVVPGLGEVRRLATAAHVAADDLAQAMASLQHAASTDDERPF